MTIAVVVTDQGEKMKLIGWTLFWIGFVLTLLAVGTGDFYLERVVAGEAGLPDPWQKEVVLYLLSLACFVSAAICGWLHERQAKRRNFLRF